MLKKSNRNLILYLDTSEKEAIVAIYEGKDLVIEQKWMAHRELSTTLSIKYEEILKKAKISGEELSGIVAFLGPGSFTGLRIGISFANGLAYALEKPIYGTKEKGKIEYRNPKKILVPEYGAPPKITKAKK
ncbi:MAG: tRNA (adenosine(37)-N6)-threonylcarbamoyltransferase complex dimerization subunit type 1 TsaB [Patescibacteria group bacterium]|nr:tRNA (adenosine(37)-N6)-threonylcarbamoyltransferase complex dimerization subunit type 1 TsaB [Patescibacteria group bacterium]